MKALVLLTALSAVVFGAQFSVVISKKVGIGSVSVQQLRELYLQKRHSIGEQKIIPVNVLGNEEVRNAFELKVLGMDRDRLNGYWVKQHFQGVTPPLTQPSFESVKAFVQNVDGAVGYIPAGMVDGGVKVLYEF